MAIKWWHKNKRKKEKNWKLNKAKKGKNFKTINLLKQSVRNVQSGSIFPERTEFTSKWNGKQCLVCVKYIPSLK